MIVLGSSRGNPGQLASYLLSTGSKNEQAEVLENSYGISSSLEDALHDMNELGQLTQGSKFLYHAQIRAHPVYQMKPEQWTIAADVLEEKLGLQGHPRVLVQHKMRNGTTHLHVVHARTDVENEKLVSDSWNYPKHEEVSLELEKRFGHELVPGVFAKRDSSKPRPTRAISYEEWQQAERKGVHPQERKDLIERLYKATDNGEAFRHAIEEEGFILAHGIQTDYILVDKFGDHHGLARQLPREIKIKHIREKFRDMDVTTLPHIDDAKRQMETHARLLYAKERKSLEQEWKDQATGGTEAREKASEARKASLDKHTREIDRHLKQARQKIKGYKAALQEELKTHKSAIGKERASIKATQEARGWLRNTLAHWFGVIKAEQERIALLEQNYRDMVQKQKDRFKEYQHNEQESFNNRRKDLFNTRLDEERSIRRDFTPKQAPEPTKEPESPARPEQDYDGPEQER